MEQDPKQTYKERYETAKQHGVRFFPEIIYKDMIVSFALFLLLAGLLGGILLLPDWRAAGRT